MELVRPTLEALQDRPLRVQEVASALGRNYAIANVSVRVLEELGYVYRFGRGTRGPNRVRVGLTAQGRDWLDAHRIIA
jgi:DNA-binding IclR family transcriptional regulator